MFGLLPIDLFAITLFLGLLGLAVVSDVEALRIPNRICAAIAALYPVHVLASLEPVDWLGALAVAFVVFAVGLIPFAAGVMGGGDVKLIAVTSLWAGPALVLEFVLVTTVIGGAIAIFMVTQLRFTLAQVCEFVGGEGVRDVFLGRSIPYAIAIAAAAYLIIGTALLSG